MARGDSSVFPDEASLHVLTAVASHPEIMSADILESNRSRLRVEVTARVPMAQRVVAKGGTQDGVLPVETLWLDFEGPLIGHRAPTVSLRADFPTNLAHIQPWKGAGGRVIPCYLYGDPDELLHSRGLGAVLDQIIVWLEDAAEGKLIDPAHGWEPTRRDGVYDDFIADEDWLAGLVKPKAGYELFNLRFFGVFSERGESVQGSLKPDRAPFTPTTYEGLYCRQFEDTFVGKGLCLVVWGGARYGAADTYRPEWVRSVADLKSRAEEFHCLSGLEDAIKRLEHARASFKATYADQHHPAIPLVVVFMARRPYPLIGSNHALEIMPYWMTLGHGSVAPFNDLTPVKPLHHRQVVSRPLLRRLSGLQEATRQPQWTLIGAGSLGSKIGLHLSRRGDGPKAVIDKSRLSPHHMARHGLLSRGDAPEDFVEGAKAERLSKSIAAFAQPCVPVLRDVRNVLEGSDAPWRRSDRALVNTTASLAVRHALSRKSANGLPRVVEAALFAGGAIGVLAIEARDRSVRITDLFETLRLHAAEDEELHDLLYSEGDGLSQIEIGQGCGSMTMAASDTSISILAAAMSEELADILTETEASPAKLVIFDRTAPDRGMTRKEIAQPPVELIVDPDKPDWSFRLHQQAAKAIDDDISLWPGVETGGVLIGRRCDFSRQVHIVDALPAPPDSERAKDRFVLGVEGRTGAISRRTRLLGSNYVALGTWHNHLEDSPPSPTDIAMARMLNTASGVSPVCVIRSPERWRVFSSPRATESETS